MEICFFSSRSSPHVGGGGGGDLGIPAVPISACNTPASAGEQPSAFFDLSRSVLFLHLVFAEHRFPPQIGVGAAALSLCLSAFTFRLVRQPLGGGLLLIVPGGAPSDSWRCAESPVHDAGVSEVQIWEVALQAELSSLYEVGGCGVGEKR